MAQYETLKGIDAEMAKQLYDAIKQIAVAPESASRLGGKNVEGRTTPSLRKWTLTQEAFDKLLIALGGNRESGSEKYLEIRNHLTRFFEWRGCPFPEDHADETFNRIARKVAEGEEILNPSGYAMGVARLLLLEIIKGRQKEQSALTEIGTASEVFRRG